MKKTLSLLFIAVLLVSLLLGCGGGETATPTITTPIELVPEKANMIGYADLSQIMEDEDIALLYEAMPIEPGDPQTLDEALDLAMEESGLDLRDSREGLMFGEISEATGDMDYFGIMVKGTFEESDLIASIESGIDEELTTVNYQGYEIYTESDEEGGLAFLGSDAFVIGSMEAVKDVIEVNKGAQPAVSGKLLDTYNGLGDALMKVAMIVPPGAIEEGLEGAAGELPMELPLDALANMHTVGMTLTTEEQSIALDLKLCFTDSDSAEDAEDLINAAILMLPVTVVQEEGLGGIPIPEEEIQEQVLELLNKLEVNTTDSCLTINLGLTLAEIEDLLAG